MNNKMTLRLAELAAATLITLTVFLTQARGAVTVYADEPSSNAAAMATPSTVETNVPATQTNLNTKSRSRGGNRDVRIDETGVHIGGPNPVDIQLPASALRGMHLGGGAKNLEDIVAIIAIFGMPVFIVAVGSYFVYRRNKLAHETIRAMIEKGMPVTPELVAELRSKHAPGAVQGRTRGGGLFPGLVLAGIGTALLISGWGHIFRTGGWIVLFIGVAFLVVWLVERQNQSNEQPPKI